MGASLNEKFTIGLGYIFCRSGTKLSLALGEWENCFHQPLPHPPSETTASPLGVYQHSRSQVSGRFVSSSQTQEGEAEKNPLTCTP
ncbi:hypothetical protein CEXT_107361 [Caerostris extrusa]|uniref:Uncharacterized protein n=1 Tax=Caerostris extrusa TaxID=172846 RepID=A0AAV4VSJ5_CAEEX|nr:hypothetical protein CEXT_107361 [Caerostris extrusa]